MEITQLIIQRLRGVHAWSAEKYYNLLTALAEDYAKGGRRKQGTIIDCILNDYQSFVSEKLYMLSEAIMSLSQFVRKGIGSIDSMQAVLYLVSLLKEWCMIIRPQLLTRQIKDGFVLERDGVFCAVKRLSEYMYKDVGLIDEAFLLYEALFYAFINAREYCDEIVDDYYKLSSIVDKAAIKEKANPSGYCWDAIYPLQVFLPLIRQLADWDQKVFADLLGENIETIAGLEQPVKSITITQYLAIRAIVEMKINSSPQENKELSALADALNYRFPDFRTREDAIKTRRPTLY